MVKKLFKHEILSYARIMPIVYVILITIAFASRIIQIFESDTTVYNIISTFSFITYGISIVAAIVFNFIFVIVRFYKNMFSGEGYLTFTLPVTSAQHIVVKALTAMLSEVCLWLAIALSFCVITFGDVFVELVKLGVYISNSALSAMGMHAIMFALEIIFLIAVTSLTNILLYYTFISIGQLFKKNRILASVGAYFVYYIITQIISTVVSIVASVLAANGAFSWVLEFVSKNPQATVHLCLIAPSVSLIGFAIICFVVIKSIITKKLNLE